MCGNGIPEPPEECDAGFANGGDLCTTGCKRASGTKANGGTSTTTSTSNGFLDIFTNPRMPLPAAPAPVQSVFAVKSPLFGTYFEPGVELPPLPLDEPSLNLVYCCNPTNAEAVQTTAAACLQSNGMTYFNRPFGGKCPRIRYCCNVQSACYTTKNFNDVTSFGQSQCAAADIVFPLFDAALQNLCPEAC